MRSKSGAYIILITLFLLATAQIIVSQDIPPKKWTVDTKGKDYQLTSQTLEDPVRIILNGHSNNNIAIIREGTSINHSINVKAWQAKYKDSGRFAAQAMMILKDLDEVASFPSENILFDGETLEIVEQNAKTRRSMIDVTIPQGKRVSLYINGDLKFSGKLTNNLLVQGGQLISNAPNINTQELFLQMIAFPDKGTKNVRKLEPGVVFPPPPNLPNNPYIVSWETLRDYASPSLPTPANIAVSKKDCPECSVAVLKLSLDNTGAISKLEQLGGSKDVARIAIATLYQWKFIPFKVNGKAVSVESIVPVQIQDGKLLFEGNSK